MSKSNEPPKAPKNGGWGIFMNDYDDDYDDKKQPKLITNFNIVVLSVIDIHIIPEATVTTHVKLKIRFDSVQDKEFTVPLSELDTTEWVNVDIRCRIYPDVPQATARRYIADHVRKNLPGADAEKVYRLNRVGVHIVEGEPVFCTGREVLRPPQPPDDSSDRPTIEPGSILYNLDIDFELSEEDAVAGMLELISLYPNAGRIDLAHNLLYLQRKVYEEAWKSPCVSILKYGETGTQKTTTSEHITQIYNRRTGIESAERLNASVPAAVDILREKNDCIAILDDLFPAEDRKLKQKQEQTLYEITRIIGDGVFPARMSGKQVMKGAPACGALFTAEYIVGLGSDAARLLPVEMTPPDSEKLKYFQDNPLIVSTFYYFYIKWFIENYSNVRDLLKEWLSVYRKTSLGVHDRLQDTHFFLNTAYVVFLEYCTDKGFVSDGEAKELHQGFLELLTDLVQAQQVRVEQGKSGNMPGAKFDGLLYIHQLYTDGKFNLAPSAKEFNEAAHDSVKHLDCLYIRGGRFREIIKAASANLNEVLDDLKAQDALHHENNARTAQLVVGKKKLRCYAIKFAKLK